MKTILLLVAFLTSFSVSATLGRPQAERLLQERNISLAASESAGARLLLGEVTGAGFVVPMEKVELVIAQNRVFLRKEIEAVDFVPHTQRLNDLSSFRAKGLYFTRDDIQATLVRR